MDMKRNIIYIIDENIFSFKLPSLSLKVKNFFTSFFTS